METIAECVCCQEQGNVRRKIEDHGEGITCITKHTNFDAVCLNVDVLQTAYYSYRQRYGPLQEDGNK